MKKETIIGLILSGLMSSIITIILIVIMITGFISSITANVYNMATDIKIDCSGEYNQEALLIDFDGKQLFCKIMQKPEVPIINPI